MRPLTLLVWFMILVCPGARAALLITEIHYNGPSSGVDPDEFLELTNGAGAPLDLGGYRFDLGVNFQFPASFVLAPFSSLVLARDAGSFSTLFTGISGPLLDFAGALSNSGETLRILDDSGSEVLSVRYDDGGAWPGSADGGGDSLQLLSVGAAPDSPDSWFAAAPTPGVSFFAQPAPVTPSALPLPSSLLLLASGLLALYGNSNGAMRLLEVIQVKVREARGHTGLAAARATGKLPEGRVDGRYPLPRSHPHAALGSRADHGRVFHRATAHLRRKDEAACLRAAISHVCQ